MSNYVTLTDVELALLDGRCSDKIQAKVDSAKARLASAVALPHLSPKDAGFVADVAKEAETQGRLIFQHRSISNCKVCGKLAGYATYTRNSRNHNKGDKNFSKPLKISGIELADRFVRFEGSVTTGCCKECWARVKSEVAKALENIRAEVPESITGSPPSLKWYRRRKCRECEWEGHEGEMGRLGAIMGGTYPGQCPKCGAKSNPFGPTVFDVLDAFSLVKVTL